MKKIGMRTIKTGVAVTIGILLANLGIVTTPVLTASACIMSMKSTLKDSLHSGFTRLLATLLGGALGYLFAVAFNGNYWYAGLGVILTIHLCYMFNFSSGIVVSSLAFTSILLGVNGNDPLSYSLGRTIDTALGVIISIVVNFSFNRKRYLNLLYSEFLATESRFLELSREISRERRFYLQEILQDELEQLNYYYDSIVNELKYMKKEADLDALKSSTDKCSQIFYHLYGIYLITNKNLLHMDKSEQELIEMYHKESVLNLLYEIDKESSTREFNAKNI